MHQYNISLNISKYTSNTENKNINYISTLEGIEQGGISREIPPPGNTALYFPDSTEGEWWLNFKNTKQYTFFLTFRTCDNPSVCVGQTYLDIPRWSAYQVLILSAHISAVIWYWSMTLWGSRSSVANIDGWNVASSKSPNWQTTNVTGYDQNSNVPSQIIRCVSQETSRELQKACMNKASSKAVSRPVLVANQTLAYCCVLFANLVRVHTR